MSFQGSTIDKDSAKDTVTAFVSLGANQPSFAGNEPQTLQAVVPHLQELCAAPVTLSSLYISDPVNCEPGTEDFVNAVARLEVPVAVSPYDLLSWLHKIEDLFGRQRESKSEPNAPRPLDLDLISFDGMVVADERLTLPHPRAAQRLFVLVPLAELCSELELAASTRNLGELIHRLPKSPGLKKL
ncbi:MAG: 2-amino-4-hydroxy-6-hydroxymethyldihydropteridine diphosphokinase [Pseudohongiellaceae bacterium]|jgi:2-amino-4-hydroxy-6-hydroxymethyldihydropteridine diphosphokinase